MDVLQPIAAVVGVLALLVATLSWLRRRGIAGLQPRKRSAGRRLECLERLPLAPNQALHLVRMGDTALLVSSGPSGCALIHSRPCREIEAAEAAR